MKIVIRKHSFETNSSSHHSLIFTNEKMKDRDIEKENYDKEPFEEPGINEVCEKEKKAYFLAGLFDYENKHYKNLMLEEYKIFLSVLEDNDENEILENIKLHKHKYLTTYGCEAYCDTFFYHGTLIDCNCGFRKKFIEYFKVNIDKERLMLEHNTVDFDFLERKVEENKNDLYQRIYDFLYKDGILIAYEYM